MSDELRAAEVRAAAERIKASAEAWLSCNPPPKTGEEWDEFGSDPDHVAHWQDELRVANTVLADPPPIDMVLPCPRCGTLHIDAPELATGWANPPHRSHKCRPEDGGCGLIWRPADVATNGVATVKTRGENDSPADDAEPLNWRWFEDAFPGMQVSSNGVIGHSNRNASEQPIAHLRLSPGGHSHPLHDAVRVRIIRADGSWRLSVWVTKVATSHQDESHATVATPGHVRRLCASLGVPLK